MFNRLVKGLFTTTQSTISIGDFLICIGAALIIGLLIALIHTYKSRCTKSFVATLAIIPSVVAMVIILVNGNLGAGVAVAGAFSLVRFRSAPGTAKEIGAIFLAMGAGLACGTGFIAYGFIFVIILGAASVIYSHMDFGLSKNAAVDKTIRVTIPEDLDYSEIFDDIFEKYAVKAELTAVKTTNMGSMFKLTYDVMLKEASCEKQLIDEIRIRNGNLEVCSNRRTTGVSEL